ncbi:hypothetical protein LXL04_036715 [Taraxacum kok-saghyz]
MFLTAKIKSVDFFRKIPRDLTEASLSGAGLSIMAAFSMMFLFGMDGEGTDKSKLGKFGNLLRLNNQISFLKTAAYASMASVVGPKRAWSRAILWKIRNRGVLARNKKRIHRISTPIRVHRHHPRRRRNPNRVVHVDPFVNSGLEVKLRKLVPGAETMDPCGLLDENADYIKYLATQVEVMRNLGYFCKSSFNGHTQNQPPVIVTFHLVYSSDNFFNGYDHSFDTPTTSFNAPTNPQQNTIDRLHLLHNTVDYCCESHRKTQTTSISLSDDE